MMRLLMLLLCSAIATTGAEFEVLVVDHDFVPPRITVQVGDTVRWYALAPEHTVTADNGEFDSGVEFDTIPEGETFSFTFESAGTYPYFCLTHGGPNGQGMSGVVTVFGSAANTSPARPAALSPTNRLEAVPLRVWLVSSAFADEDKEDFHSASQWVIRGADNSVIHDSSEDSINLTQWLTPSLPPGGALTWQVRYKDARGGWSEYSAPAEFRTVAALNEERRGLLAEYFNSAPAGSALARTTNAVIDFHWNDERPHRRITGPMFGIRWTGSILPAFSEEYRLTVRVRGAVRLWVNDQLLVDGAGCDFEQDVSGEVALGAGKLAAVQIEYTATAPEGSLQLFWLSATQPREIIPAARLVPPGVTQE